MDNGILNEELFDKIVNISNINLEDINKNITKFKNVFTSLNSCYYGKCFDFISNGVNEQINNLDKLFNVTESYVSSLSSVKLFYQKADQEIANNINLLNSQIERRN